VTLTPSRASFTSGGASSASMAVSGLYQSGVPNPASPATDVSILCVTRSTSSGSGVNRYASVPALTLTATFVRTRWPLFIDAVLSLGQGLLRSAWSSAAVQVQAQLLGNSTVINATENQEASDASNNLMSMESLLAVASQPRAGSSFSLTLSGAANLTLVAAGSGARRQLSLNARPRWLADTPASRFNSATQVFIGGKPCRIHWVDPDGGAITFTSPTLEELCPSFNASAASSEAAACGLQSLVINNMPQPSTQEEVSTAVAVLGTVTSSALQTPLGAFGAVVSCPPVCPGGASSSSVGVAVPVPVLAADGSVSYTASGSASLAASAVTGIGIYYVAKCQGDYTDPATGACLNATDPASARCAFGVGDSCQLCFQGALCPGGNRAWPLPGYWSPSETQPPTRECCSWTHLLYIH
jgi:hypothetical protein